MVSEVISVEILREYIKKIEYLENEKANFQNDIKDVFAEAKARGFNVKVIRQILRLKKMDHQALQEQDSLLSLYRDAIGI